MEPAQELSADRRPIDNRHPPNRRARWRVLPTAAMERLNTARQAIARVGAKPALPALRVESSTDFAISIGAAFEAHIAGIAFAFDPVVTPAVLDGLSSTWVDVQRDESRAAAKAAIDRFETAAKREGLSAEHRLFKTSLGDAIGLFGRIARRFDLSVVKQQEPDRPNGDDLIIEASLFQSGRPAVVVPYIQKAPVKLERVLVTWDGSHGAARAIGGRRGSAWCRCQCPRAVRARRWSP
jgi:hypothetical protein